MRTNVNINQIQNSNKVFFGPFVGELGWELFRWSGFVRWIRNKHPDKNIVVATRKGREDLYYKTASKIETFEITGDYRRFKPNMYRLDGYPNQKLQSMIDEYKQKYSGWYFVEPPMKTNNRNVFRPTFQNFNIKTHPKNAKCISNILSNVDGKIIITLSPRKRTDLSSGGKMHDRNWKAGYWEELFDLIDSSNKYCALVLGKSPTFIRPLEILRNLVVVEDKVNEGCTSIGLTVEALKQSVLTIGQHSAIPILSNYLKTPTLMWGEDRNRHAVLENPYRTPCLFVDDRSFSVAPTKIFSLLNRIISEGK